MAPRDFLAYAKKHKAEMVDLKFTDLLDKPVPGVSVVTFLTRNSRQVLWMPGETSQLHLTPFVGEGAGVRSPQPV